MLSIQNETVLRDSASGALDTWRGLVPRGSALDQIMEDALNHAVKAVADSNADEDLEEELEEAKGEAATYKARAAARAAELAGAEKALAKERSEHEAARAVVSELRASAAALIWLIPGSVSLGELRDLQRTFAADFAELERLRVFEATRVEADRQQAEAKAAAPIWEPQPCSAEIPEEMFVPRFFRQMTDQGEVVIDLNLLSPEKREEIERYVEALKKAKTEPVQITADPSPSRKRLDGIARRAQEVADGPCKVTDVRRLADLVSMLTNAVEPRR